jgi:hypothetical protein
MSSQQMKKTGLERKRKRNKNKKRGLRVSLRPTSSVRDKSQIHSWLSESKSRLVELKDRKTFRPLRGVRVSTSDFAPADVTLAKNFVSLNQVYRFRLGGHATIGYSSGVLDDFLPCDPSASGLGFPEWPTLSALFSEFKLVELQVQFLRQRQSSNDYATQFNNPIIIAGNLGTAAAPGSYANLADNADAVMWQAASSTSDRGYTHVLKGTNLNWSVVSTPTTDPFAGAPGSIQMYGTASSGVPNDVIHCLVVGIYDFRSRV